MVLETSTASLSSILSWGSQRSQVYMRTTVDRKEQLFLFMFETRQIREAC